jgi:hypothetical protein
LSFAQATLRRYFFNITVFATALKMERLIKVILFTISRTSLVYLNIFKTKKLRLIIIRKV